MNDEQRIARAAAYWTEQINRPAVDADQSADFDAWIRADPRHGEAFATMQALWDSSALEAGLSDPHLLDDGDDDEEAAVGDDAAPQQPVRRWRWAAGAAAVAILACAPLLMLSHSVQRVDTGRGSGASIVLADGTRVELSPNTQIEADYRPWRRTVSLLRGEAYFDVRHQPWRTFRVASGVNEVKVLGTAFNVDRQSDSGTVVEVFRGRVGLGLRDGDLRPVDAGTVGRLDGTRLTVSPLDPSQRQPEWKNGWFDAVEVPLSVLIDKLNRYSAKMIVVRRQDLLNRNITGRFRVVEVKDTLEALEAAYGVRPRETSDSIILE